MTVVRVLAFGGRFLLGLFAAYVVLLLVYRFAPVTGTTLMGMRSVQGEEVAQSWVAFDEISPHLVRGVIAAEDTKFCRHFGFDLGEMKAAYEDWRSGGGLRGASTVSQQTAKNAFLWPGRDPVRKLAEMGMTLPLEAGYSKRRIMEIYLNVAEWGDGLFGAEAASLARFGKPASDLTRREAALLASVLPSPNKWRVDPPGPYVARRSRQIEARMRTVEREGFDDCVFRR